MPNLTPEQIAVLLAVPMHARPDVYRTLTNGDGADCPVRCDAPGCGAVIPLRASYSHFVMVRVAGEGMEPVACEHETSDSGQHFGCSPDHAEAAMLHCWHTHVKPAHHAALTQKGRHGYDEH